MLSQEPSLSESYSHDASSISTLESKLHAFVSVQPNSYVVYRLIILYPKTYHG